MTSKYIYLEAFYVFSICFSADLGNLFTGLLRIIHLSVNDENVDTHCLALEKMWTPIVLL
jgi:hypothetical protein